MKKRLRVFIALLGAAACSDTVAPARLSPGTEARLAASPAAQGQGPIQDEYIVVFRDDVADPPGLAKQLAAAHGATVRFTYRSALKGFAAHMSAAAAQALQNNPNVSFVEQDQTMAAIASETLLNGEPWGLDRIDQTSSALNSTYNYTDTGLGVVAYIIDTGIRTSHSEFGGRASGGFTAISDGNGTNDCHGHGTHVSGTVGGSTYGVAKAVTLVAVRVLDCSGSGSTAGVIAGIDWVTANHASPAVANMSLGGGASSSLDLAVNNSIAAGVAYAIAAGNGNFVGIAQNACNYSPARVAAAMTIGATTTADSKTSWSNYGSCVDWFAPGNGIKSAWNTDDNATNTISGTSMATPHVTGVAALYLQTHHSATPQQLRDALYAATLKGVVTNSKTTNNHLLYSPPGGFGGGGGPPPNAPPKAAFTEVCIDLSCNFADQSTDDVGIASRSWNFGDGGTSTVASPSHSYTGAGTFTVSLIVTDGGGLTNTTSHSVTVQAPPVATLTGTGSKSKSTWTTSISWSGFPGTVSSFDIYRNGALLTTVLAPTNSYIDSGKGGGTFVYKVCETSTTVCTNELPITP